MTANSIRPAAVPTIQIDNERMTVTRWNFSAGAETGWHRHACDYIVVPLNTGKLLAQSHEGSTTFDLTAGVSYTRGAGVEHNVININDSQFEFIEIELKS